MKKIVLFTANTKGGIIQFTLQIYKVLKNMNFDVNVFIPDEVTNSDVSFLGDDLSLYKKEKKIVDNKSYKQIACDICSKKPDLLWYMDNSIVSVKVGLNIRKKVKQYLTMHDAGNNHPTHNTSLKYRLNIYYNRFISNSFFKLVDKFILLSSESVKVFSDNFPKYSDLVIKMNLGAHIPDDDEIIPSEMESLVGKHYLLFFGKIDKYKGIVNLVDYYNKSSNCDYPLVIAGGGNLSDLEKQLINANDNIFLLNRYILDGEMKWLIANATMVTLAYIEASQSGIIPIAYNYGVPVMVSNVLGLTQFVENTKTGFICCTEQEWIDKFNSINHDICLDMKSAILKYYDENMDWYTNIKNITNSI